MSIIHNYLQIRYSFSDVDSISIAIYDLPFTIYDKKVSFYPPKINERFQQSEKCRQFD